MTLDVLAIGAHPDDVEIGCGGTLARLESGGHAVGIVALTAGEAGTRGEPAVRRREAAAAAAVLGASLEILDCGDGGLRCDRESEDALIALLRAWRPRLVLVPPRRDRHPDHQRAHRLAVDACFYAGLAKRCPRLGSPHRPGLLLSYMLHDPFEPTLIVDVSDHWKRKEQALSCHASQFGAATAGGDEGEADEAPETKISAAEFRPALAGRGRHFGQLIGVAYGEPFAALRPLAAGDLFSLLPARP